MPGGGFGQKKTSKGVQTRVTAFYGDFLRIFPGRNPTDDTMSQGAMIRNEACGGRKGVTRSRGARGEGFWRRADFFRGGRARWGLLAGWG